MGGKPPRRDSHHEYTARCYESATGFAEMSPGVSESGWAIALIDSRLDLFDGRVFYVKRLETAADAFLESLQQRGVIEFVERINLRSENGDSSGFVLNQMPLYGSAWGFPVGRNLATTWM